MRRVARACGTVVLVATVCGLSACNTWEGMKRDASSVADHLNNGKKK